MLILLLSACATADLEIVRAQIPESLTAPVPYPSLDNRVTDADVADLIIDYEGALDQANGQLAGIRELMN